MPDEFSEQDFAPAPSEEFSESDFIPKEEALGAALKLGTGAGQLVHSIITNPLVAQASEMGQQQGPEVRRTKPVRFEMSPEGVASPVFESSEQAAEYRKNFERTAGQLIGRPLGAIGRGVRNLSFAEKLLLTGQPRGAAEQLKILPPEIPSEQTPLETGLAALPAPLRAASTGAYSTVESGPRMAAVAAAQSMGIPAPVAAAAFFGLTDEGFDAKQAAIAAALPAVGKYSGEIAETLASKLGVTSDQALNLVQRLGGAGGAAALLSADELNQIAQLPADRRRDAIVDAVGNIGSMTLLGAMGETRSTEFRTERRAAQELRDILGGAPKTLTRREMLGRVRPPGELESTYALHGKTKTPVRDMLEPARPEEGARSVPPDEGRQEAGPRSGKPPDKTQEAPQPGDAEKGQTRVLLTPAKIAEQVGGWKFEGEIKPYKIGNVEVPGVLRFTGTEEGKKTTIHIPSDATPEEIAQRLTAKSAEFGLPIREHVSEAVKAGIDPKDVYVTVSPEQIDPATGKPVKGTAYVQVDVRPPGKPAFSTNPDEMRRAGFDMPTKDDFLKLGKSQLALPEALGKLGLGEPPAPEKPPGEAKPPEIATKPEIPATKPPETPTIPGKGPAISAPQPRPETAPPPERPPPETPKEQTKPVAATTARAQKKFLISEASKALAEAQEGPLETEEGAPGYETDEAAAERRGRNSAVLKANQAKYGTVTIEVPGDGTFTLINNKTSIQDFLKRAAKFPLTGTRETKVSVPRTEPTAPVKLGSASEKDLAASLQEHASSDPTRKVLQYSFSNGNEVVATDGRRLIRIHKLGAGGTPENPVALDAAGKVVEDPGGIIPAWKQVIPEEKSIKVGFKALDTERLFNILTQAMHSTSERAVAVKLYRNVDGSIAVTAGTPEISYEHNRQPGAKPIVSIDPAYLIDAVNAVRRMGDKTLDFWFSKKDPEISPVMVRGTGVDVVIMPMRMDGGAAIGAERAHSDFTEVGPGDETKRELARHGTPTGLPPGVPDNGPDFPMELMEASRRFGTVVRSRATLPPGVLGMYSRRLAGAKMFDKIEVGDLHNQLTVAHEMGHDLDQLLWPQVNLARTQKSFEARVGSFGTGKEIQGELIPISELMRGPIAGSKGHQAYRRSATELIADYFALYAHDPERARAMAPKFSKGFEAALARVPDADATVKQLHAGNVDPVVPSPGKGPVQQAAEMPGAVPARPEASPWPREVEAAEASQEVVATGIRDFEAAKQKGRVVEDRWRQLVRSQEDRNDVGAAAEGTGNLEKPGDTRNAVISRLTPAKKDLLKRYRFRVEQERGEINNYLKNVTEQEYLAFLPDYFAHFYVNAKTPAGQQAMARFIKSSPNAKQRKIPTLQEAAELGLKPISQDPAVVFTHYVALNWRVATNLKVIDAIGDLRTAAGTPVVLPKGQAPPEYVRTDNPLLQRVYARKGPKGEVHLWRAGVAVHPDVWPALRQMLDAPASSSLGKAWDVFNSITRANAFAFSLFHDLTLRTASVGQQWTWYNPARGLFRIFEHNPVTGELEVFRGARGLGKELMADEKTVVDAAKHGLRFSWTESESYERNARDTLDRLAARWRETPYLGKAARIARDLQRFRQEGLWKNTHDAFKILAYEDLTRKALQEAPQGTDPKLVKQRIASALNDAFGGQEWQTKFWLSPQARRVMSRYFLAPDWTFSTLRSIPFASDVVSTLRGNAPRLAGREPIPTRMEGLAGNAQRLRFWGGELAALAMATLAGQYAIYQAFGRKDLGDQPWVWDNEYGQKRRIDVTPIMRQMPWHKAEDPTRYYVNLGKRPEEILGWFTHGDSTLFSKLSRPAAEIMRQILGTEGEFKAPWKRDHESFIESLPTRAKEFSGQFFPFVFQGNQFALSLPYRKGMTKYKAQQAYESTYELAANPGAFTGARAFLRGVPNPQGTLDEMVSKITEAAEGNGVNTEPIRQRALSVVRGHWYDEFFKAVDKGDDAKMTRAAEALERLGTTPEGFGESQERRQQMQPVPP